MKTLQIAWTFRAHFSDAYERERKKLRSLVKSGLVLCVQSCLTLCNPMDCSPSDLLSMESSRHKNTGASCHCLLQGIFQIQGSNPGLLHLLPWQAGSLVLALPGMPKSGVRNEFNVSLMNLEPRSGNWAVNNDLRVVITWVIVEAGFFFFLDGIFWELHIMWNEMRVTIEDSSHWKVHENQGLKCLFGLTMLKLPLGDKFR